MLSGIFRPRSRIYEERRLNRPFHYAFRVTDLTATRDFYTRVIGCREGRSTASWIDFDFFGNQISAHLADRLESMDPIGEVDAVKVPIPHFGAILSLSEFNAVKHRLEESGASFIVEPYLRYAGQKGQQYTLFLLDPSGNSLEFKSFVDEHELFSG